MEYSFLPDMASKLNLIGQILWLSRDKFWSGGVPAACVAGVLANGELCLGVQPWMEAMRNAPTHLPRYSMLRSLLAIAVLFLISTEYSLP